MDGYANVAYIPNGKIIGLSKVNRIVRYFSQRPQVQERLTAQIADSLSIVLDTPHVAVATTAKHSCVTARGVQDCHSSTSTHILRGDFKDNAEVRREFFEIINARQLS
jgi:GTP cyclohydrolase I